MNTTKTWKRLVSVLLAVVLLLSIAPVGPYMDVQTNAATATKVYMKPSSEWKIDGARFAAYFFQSGKAVRYSLFVIARFQLASNCPSP